MSSLKDKVIAITGATGGIGLATAHLLASHGAILSLADVSQEKLDALVSGLASNGTSSIGIALDVRKSSEVSSWITRTVSEFGCLDGAANLAGVIGATDFKGVAEMEDANWDLIIGVNLTGVMYCMRAELTAMLKAGTKGAVVNAASLSGLRGRPGISAYVASKHGVVGLTKTAAREVGKQGVRVNAVCPGPVDTPMLSELLGTPSSEEKKGVTNTYDSLPLGRVARPDEVAKAIVYLLSDDASYITGVAFPVDAGATA
ncbi:MAG: hypothetical protein M1820_009454 [Bogoriella megaspora]|nr:MAG: hypothetical protein M1820_009454 [Bogoriella megaspora]